MYFSSDTSGSKLFVVVQVGSATSGFGIEFHLKILNFSIFLPSGQKKSHGVRLKNTRVKDGLATFLLQVESMLGLGRVKAHLYHTHHQDTLSGFFNPHTDLSF